MIVHGAPPKSLVGAQPPKPREGGRTFRQKRGCLAGSSCASGVRKSQETHAVRDLQAIRLLNYGCSASIVRAVVVLLELASGRSGVGADCAASAVSEEPCQLNREA